MECKSCNPDFWMGYKVEEIEEYQNNKDTDIVLVALSSANQEGVKNKLEKEGYKHIFLINEKSGLIL